MASTVIRDIGRSEWVTIDTLISARDLSLVKRSFFSKTTLENFQKLHYSKTQVQGRAALYRGEILYLVVVQLVMAPTSCGFTPNAAIGVSIFFPKRERKKNQNTPRRPALSYR
ncbi:TPA: hypothetical protein ACGUO9_004194 [Vibrio vulnificus]